MPEATSIYTLDQLNLTPGVEYRISFEYLGLAVQGSNPGDLGGFAGLSEGLPGRHLWYYGTSSAAAATPVLVDDGQWRTYTFDFTAPVPFPFPFGSGGSGNTVRLMFEDFSGSGGVARDAYFDNVSLGLVPEPSSFVVLFGIGSMALLRRRVA